MKHTSSDWLHEKPKSLSPNEYKKIFFAIYKRRADKLGVKFGPRNFKKIENGFCFEYARNRENKGNLIAATFWWFYSDVFSDFVLSENPLFKIITKDR